MTLEKIRAALPTHIMLTPGMQKLQIGDEIFFQRKRITLTVENGLDHLGYVNWQEEDARRPIPPEVLDNQAFWIRLGKDYNKFPSRDLVVEIGGFENWEAYFKAGRLYDKWLLEQMEGA